MSGTRLLAAIDSLAERGGKAPWVVEQPGGVAWSALRMHAAVMRLSARLGASPRGPLLMALPNSGLQIALFFAALRAGRWVLPLSPDLPAAAMVEAARTVGATTAVVDAARTPLLETEVDEVFTAEQIASPGPVPHAVLNEGGEGGLLIHSSGTTGLPKVVRRTLCALESVAVGSLRAIGFSPDDHLLIVLPLFHSYGIDQLLTALLAGTPISVCERFDPAEVARQIPGTTILPGVPFLFEMLSAGGSLGPCPRLRRAISAGAALPKRVFEAFEQATGVQLSQIYGATEFASVTFNDPLLSDFDPQSVGRPFEGVKIDAYSSEAMNPAKPLPAGVVGQLAVSAPSMMSGYLDAVPPMVGSQLLSGDLGRIDACGRVYLTGRTKLLFDVGGQKVNPLEVEAVLMEHPAVADAVVLAEPLSDTLNRVRAVVTRLPGTQVDSAALRRHVRERLIGWKVPRVVEFRDSLPRSATGKILRGALQL